MQNFIIRWLYSICLSTECVIVRLNYTRSVYEFSLLHIIEWDRHSWLFFIMVIILWSTWYSFVHISKGKVFEAMGGGGVLIDHQGGGARRFEIDDYKTIITFDNVIYKEMGVSSCENPFFMVSVEKTTIPTSPPVSYKFIVKSFTFDDRGT